MRLIMKFQLGACLGFRAGVLGFVLGFRGLGN